MIARAGTEMVINLALIDSKGALANEGALVGGEGMIYVHIPVVFEKPELRDLEKFLGILALQKGQPVLVHCALNYRASAFVALHRILSLGVDLDTAMKDVRRIWEPIPVWSDFMDRAIRTFG